jgi:soluble lytic murein transglycosylase
VVRDSAPRHEYYRADFHFMPGWIALRYLNDLLDGARILPILTMERLIRLSLRGRIHWRWPRRRGDRRERPDASQL